LASGEVCSHQYKKHRRRGFDGPLRISRGNASAARECARIWMLLPPLSSSSMPHRKHGVKTRVAFVPAAGFAVGFPS
jgi:hypothetical protein